MSRRLASSPRLAVVASLAIAAMVVSGCGAIYASVLPGYNSCPRDTEDAWGSDAQGSRHSCVDASHRLQGGVRAWRAVGQDKYALVLSGTYKDGIPVGEWQEWTASGSRKTTWDERGRPAHVQELDDQGALLAESAGDGVIPPLVDRGGAQWARNGRWIEHGAEPEGGLWEVGYQDGYKTGHARHLDASGRVVEEGDFVNDARVGAWAKSEAPPKATVAQAKPDASPAKPAATKAGDTVGASWQGVASSDESAAPWQVDVTIGGRGGGTAPVGGYAYVVDAKAYVGWAAWPKGRAGVYVGVGGMATIGQSWLDACGRASQPSCPDAITGSLGPEARVGFAAMYDNETRQQASVIVFLGLAPSLRQGRTVDTSTATTMFALRATMGVAVPYAWHSWTTWNESKKSIPWFFPNHVEVVYETTSPAYLAHPGSWGGGGGYSF